MAAWEAGTTPPPYPSISDDEIRETIEGSQLRLMDERGIDLTVFSPARVGHGAPRRRRGGQPGVGPALQRPGRTGSTPLYPDRFVGVAQLPQSPGAPIGGSVAELRRCVEELGFVGCNLNPDPSGGHWTSPPLTDRSWYPFYEAMVELDVPAMVHVSAVGQPRLPRHRRALPQRRHHRVHAAAAGRPVRATCPDLRLVIPHGGGAVPYHWGRYRGLADMLERPPLEPKS